ncbi:MAG: MetQ/NlpA family ABC transporter substrate-binding protein [Chlamydiales bacterium]|nr:MetQ/NlpA family ABC transporter substrate-binding protein [Chlamydiales bacterium]
MKRLLLCLLLCACTHNDNKIRVAASSTPHAEILQEAKKNLKDQGVELKIVEIDDYIVPNRLLAEKQVDANFFQHEPYLELQEEKFGYNFRVLTRVHIEPLGIYSHKIKRLGDIPYGATVAIPNDPTNEARALYLLEDKGLIKIQKAKLPTPRDIIANPKNLKFQELEAPLLPRSLSDVTIAVIPSNFALMGKISPKEALATESSDSPYANIVVVRSNDHREALEKLRRELESKEISDFIKKKYEGAILPSH